MLAKPSAPCHRSWSRRWCSTARISGDSCEADVAQVLIPELRLGDAVIMDKLSIQKRAAVNESSEAVGASLRFLGPYSPDFNSVEKVFSQLKPILPNLGERTWSALP